MPTTYTRFLRQLLIFTIILAIPAVVAKVLLPSTFITPVLPFLFPFFIATTLISFRFLLHATSQRFMKFVNTFLLTVVVKLFLYAGIMVGYSLLNRTDAVSFLLSFFVLYLCYTVFESVSIIRIAQPSTGTKAE